MSLIVKILSDAIEITCAIEFCESHTDDFDGRLAGVKILAEIDDKELTDNERELCIAVHDARRALLAQPMTLNGQRDTSISNPYLQFSPAICEILVSNVHSTPVSRTCRNNATMKPSRSVR
ncbi:MAG: hypothetical protein LUQ38_00970 [Methanotrichaceae archaeon]|nr:hypothetical protein [Methanotrichaceae archaeon]